ncbi:nuclear transport factor 2 family protein [Nocardia sp. NPDC058379]|uniref:nuclear transport factor 2 family protein n=1 Tax=unclassified Nocardia TaxID=2637762 RepID=UPI0036557F5B
MNVTDESVAGELRRLADHQAVTEVCTRMAWHTDHREWDVLATLFAGEVRLDYTSLNGGQPSTLSPEQIVEGWSQVLGGFDSTHHLLGHPVVSLVDDTAVCTAPFQATHRLVTGYGDSLWTLGGTYRFDLRRIGDHWQITGVTMHARWGDGNERLLEHAADRSTHRKAPVQPR